MALLQVYKNGNKIKEVELPEGGDWIAGRGSSSDLILEGEQSISRQHFKIVKENGSWTAKVLSRYGEFYHEGNKTESIDLKDGTRFQVPPFEFVFSESPVQAEPNNMDLSERTYVGALSVHPYLKVLGHHGEVLQVFRLEGQSWVAGRDTSCPLFVDNPKFSRRHFEIRLEEGAYLVKDLESSNGTLLNGEILSSVSWVPIKSGDVLTVVDCNMHFELRDAAFENRLQEIPQELLSLPIYASEISPESLYQPQANPAMPSSGKPGRGGFKIGKGKVNWVRMVIYVLLVGGAVAYFSPKQQKDSTPQAKNNLNPFEKLTPQQQQYVKDTYRLADRLFKEGRYEMARQEVAKVHQLIPRYEESKNLEKLAEVAIQTQIEQQKAEAREREKLEMEEKIQRTVAECAKKVNSKVEMKTIEDCLMPVIPLDPENPAILSLKAEADRIISERIERNERRAEYLRQVRKQKHLYERAKKLQASGKQLEAIEAMEAVAESRLPDPQNLKTQARRTIASIQKNLADSQATLQAQADEAIQKGDLKTAVLTLKKAIAINPENETLKGKVNSLVHELKRQMQTLYQEGVLEESVGEIDTAKAKWKKILETSVPDEDYYKKAKSKLKKYEAL